MCFQGFSSNILSWTLVKQYRKNLFFSESKKKKTPIANSVSAEVGVNSAKTIQSSIGSSLIDEFSSDDSESSADDDSILEIAFPIVRRKTTKKPKKKVIPFKNEHKSCIEKITVGQIPTCARRYTDS